MIILDKTRITAIRIYKSETAKEEAFVMLSKQLTKKQAKYKTYSSKPS